MLTDSINKDARIRAARSLTICVAGGIHGRRDDVHGIGCASQGGGLCSRGMHWGGGACVCLVRGRGPPCGQNCKNIILSQNSFCHWRKVYKETYSLVLLISHCNCRSDSHVESVKCQDCSKDDCDGFLKVNPNLVFL